MTTNWSFENGFKRAKKCGFMLKANEQDQWLLRWFVLQDSFLYYFDKVPTPDLRGSFSIDKAVIETVKDTPKMQHVFKIITPGKKEYMVAAESEASKKEWIESLQQRLRLATWHDTDTTDTKMEGISDELQPLFNPRRTGFLYKPSYGTFAGLREWKRRFFVLNGDKMYYYHDVPDMTSKGQIPVEKCQIEEVHDDAHPYRMKLSVMGRTFHLCAESTAEQYAWMRVIDPSSVYSESADPLRDAVLQALDPVGASGAGGAAGSTSGPGRSSTARRPSASLASVAQLTPPKKEVQNPGVKLDTPSVGKHTIRMYSGQDLFSTFLITDTTTAMEALEMLVRKMRLEEDPQDYGLYEQTDRIFVSRILDDTPVVEVLRKWKEVPNWGEFRLIYKLRSSEDVVNEVKNEQDEEPWNLKAMDMFVSGVLNTELLEQIGYDVETELPVNDELAGGDDGDDCQEQDYQIKVHIIEAREIRGMSKAGSSDPVVHVKCMGKTQKTQVFKERANCYFDKVVTFDFTVLPSELFSEHLLLEVWDNNLIIDTFIGMHQFDIQSIYKSPGHEMYKTWVPITNLGRKKLKEIEKEEREKAKEKEKIIKKLQKKAAKLAESGGGPPPEDGGGAAAALGSDDKDTDVLGYLLVTVTVLGPGDVLPVHNEEEDEEGGAEGGDLESATLSAPDMKTINYYLNVRAYCGESLFAHDTLGSLNTYVEVRFAGSRAVHTQPASGTAPEWNEEIKVPVKIPEDETKKLSSDAIYVRIVQSRFGIGHARDKVLGTAEFSFKEIKEKGWGPKWYNIYGAPARMAQSKEIKAMNLGRTTGTEFRGRILLQLNVEPNPKPVAQVKKVTGGRKPKTAQYTLRFDLYEVNGLPSGPGQFEVKLKWAEHRLASSAIFSLDGSARWAKSFDDLRAVFPGEVDQLPDIFINVYRRSLGAHLRVGLLRIKCEDLVRMGEKGFGNPVQWGMLEHDQTSLAYSRGDLAGFLLYRLDFGLTANVPRGSRQKIIEPHFRNWQFRAHIFQGEDMLVADMNGLSDPYVKVAIAGKHGRTDYKEECLNPVWYTTIHFEVDLSENLPPPDLNVSVRDYSAFTFGNPQVLGRFTLPMSTVAKQHSLPEPKWYDLYLEKPADTHGRIMASFQLIPKEMAREVPLPSLVPAQRAARVEIIVIGLRGVPAFQLRDLQNPFIEFDMGDRSKAQSTKYSQKGSNITFLERIEFVQTLPIDERYVPVVNVRIVDRRGVGLIHALVGDTAVPLRPHIPWGPTALRKFRKILLDSAKEDVEKQAKAKAGAASRPSLSSCDGGGNSDSQYTDDDDMVGSPVNGARSAGGGGGARGGGGGSAASRLGSKFGGSRRGSLGERDIAAGLAAGGSASEADGSEDDDDATSLLRRGSAAAAASARGRGGSGGSGRHSTSGRSVSSRTSRAGPRERSTLGGGGGAFVSTVDADPLTALNRERGESGGLPASLMMRTATPSFSMLCSQVKASISHSRAQLMAAASAVAGGKSKSKGKEAATSKCSDPHILTDAALLESLEKKGPAVVNAGLASFLGAKATSSSASASAAAAGAKKQLKDKDGGAGASASGGAGGGGKGKTGGGSGGSGGGGGVGSSSASIASGKGGDDEIEMSKVRRDDDDEGTHLLGAGVNTHHHHDGGEDHTLENEAEGADSDNDEPDMEPGPLSRPRVQRQLEKCPEWFNMPFDEYVIGRLKPLTSPLQKLPAGKLKLHVRVLPTSGGSSGGGGGNKSGAGEEYGDDSELTMLPRLGAPLLRELKSVYKPFDCVVRLYLVRGTGLKSMDSNGFSDPYAEVSWGKRFEMRSGMSWARASKPLRSDIHNRTLNPEFRCCFELKSTLPGNSDLEINIIDHDQIGHDDPIGVTRIDVENRWYSEKWRANNPYKGEWSCSVCNTCFAPPKEGQEPYKCKRFEAHGCEGMVTNVDMKRQQPLEIRPLRARGSSNVTGSIECFVEIWGVQAADLYPPLDITPPPPDPFELRICIFEVKNVIMPHEIGDLKVTAQLTLKYAGDVSGANERVLETDVHGGSPDGNGNFNFRFKWPVDMPCKLARLQLQVRDDKLVGKDDALGEVNVSLKRHLDRALRAYRKHGERFQGVVYRDQWLTFRHPNKDGERGKVKIRMDIVTGERASREPVGDGRKEVNRHPFLPEPTGRNARRWELHKKFGNFLGNKFGGVAKGAAICFCVLLVLFILAIVIYLTVLKPKGLTIPGDPTGPAESSGVESTAAAARTPAPSAAPRRWW